jgi:hypothetical protein
MVNGKRLLRITYAICSVLVPILLGEVYIHASTTNTLSALPSTLGQTWT